MSRFTEMMDMGDSEANYPSIPSLNTDWPNVGSVFSKQGLSPLWRKITDAPQLPGGGVDDWHSIVRARPSKELGYAGSNESELWG
jgi:hypothetical protein